MPDKKWKANKDRFVETTVLKSKRSEHVVNLTKAKIKRPFLVPPILLETFYEPNPHLWDTIMYICFWDNT